MVTNIQCDLYGGAEECDGQPGGDPDAGSDDCVIIVCCSWWQEMITEYRTEEDNDGDGDDVITKEESIKMLQKKHKK